MSADEFSDILWWIVVGVTVVIGWVCKRVVAFLCHPFQCLLALFATLLLLAGYLSETPENWLLPVGYTCVALALGNSAVHNLRKRIAPKNMKPRVGWLEQVRERTIHTSYAVERGALVSKVDNVIKDVVHCEAHLTGSRNCDCSACMKARKTIYKDW